jgi:hypothetical protein
MENSWYIKRDGLHHFFCQCGTHDILENNIENNSSFEIIKFKRDEIEFSKIPNLFYPDNCCKLCGNERYLDMKSLFFEAETRIWSEIKWTYEIKENEESWTSISFLNVPIFEENSTSVMFKKLKLSTAIISKYGKSFYTMHHEHFFEKSMIIDGKHWSLSQFLHEDMSQNILKFIIENPLDSIKWLKEDINSLDELIFFLEYPNICFKDIYFWKNSKYFLEQYQSYQNIESFLDFFLNHRKEKSLRKAHFNAYKEMMQNGGYNPLVDYIFSRVIEDRNHLLKILNMDITIKESIFNYSSIADINYFMDFLKRHYHEKHIVRFWLSITKEDLTHFLVRDVINLFSADEMRVELNENFEKTPLNIKAIHDELMRRNRRVCHTENKVFIYSDAMVKAQVKLEDISYVLPINSQTLNEWGRILHNCLFFYSNKVFNREITIFGLFVDNKLMYAIEIERDIIVQASSAYNKALTSLEQEKIDRWYKDVYLGMVMQKNNRV